MRITFVFQNIVKNWEKESGGFATTSLSTCHEVPFVHDNWNGILLDRSRFLVSRFSDIVSQQLSKAHAFKRGSGWRSIVATALDLSMEKISKSFKKLHH